MEPVKMKPIPFTAQEVRATLAGRQSQIRRVIKPQPFGPVKRQAGLNFSDTVQLYTDGEKIFSCPYGQTGMNLWARETWNAWMTGVDECDPYLWTALKGHNRSDYEHGDIAWRATDLPLDPDTESPFWAPSIHMPRWASRITLEVVNVRVEQVSSITSADAEAEGIVKEWDGTAHWYKDYQPGATAMYKQQPVKSFMTLWDSINAKRGVGWEENPFVWVIEFKVVGAR